jgi:hypothetical protein
MNMKKIIAVFCGSFLFNYTTNCQLNKRVFIPDTSVNKIELSDYRSTERVLGDSVWGKKFESDGLFPRIELINRARTQVLRLFFHYGGSKNSVDEFEMLDIDRHYKMPEYAIALDIDSFKTSRRIVLDIRKDSLINILGNGCKAFRKKSGYEELYYEVVSPSNLLKRYKQYKYYVKCVLKKGRLIKYSFGFKYP